MNVGLVLPLLLAAAPAAPSIPDKWDADLQAALPAGQRLAQKLVGDLDGDKKPEWVAIGEPAPGRDGQVSIAIFAPPQGKGKPTLRFSQWMNVERATQAGAVIRNVKPVGPAVILVAAVPDPGGDSVFRVNVYAYRGKDFRPLVPERLEFKSQGGFTFDDIDPESPGEELVAWTYLTEEGEQLYDYHRYAHVIFRFDGIRWARERREKRSTEKYPTPAAAAKAIGLKNEDIRKTVPRIAAAP
jgi:hypothetical protein